MKKLVRFLKDKEGITATECGLIATLFAVVILVAMATIGLRLFTAIYTTGTSSP